MMYYLRCAFAKKSFFEKTLAALHSREAKERERERERAGFIRLVLNSIDRWTIKHSCGLIRDAYLGSRAAW